jgi:multiple sugar transport system substrate-binding protein
MFSPNRRTAAAFHPNSWTITSRRTERQLRQRSAVAPLGGALAGGASLYVGPSLANYRFAGHVWAAPIDAATPHSAFRLDLLSKAGEPTPANWEETVQLGKRLRRAGLWIATPVTSPHCFATVASLMANLGCPIATDPGKPFAFDRAATAEAFDALDAVIASSPPETLGWNAIGLSEAMVARDEIVFTPAIYG